MKFSKKRCKTLDEIKEFEIRLDRDDFFDPTLKVPNYEEVRTGLECLILSKESFDSCRK